MSVSQATLMPRMAPECGDGELRFILPCVPTAQQRPRHATMPNGFHRAYKSRAQEANEETLAALLRPYVPQDPMRGALELEFVACFPVPASASRKDRARMLAGEIGHTVKPDLDNLAKQLKDAMTRMRFWHDDRQVARLLGMKRYAENPRWEVRLRRIADARK